MRPLLTNSLGRYNKVRSGEAKLAEGTNRFCVLRSSPILRSVLPRSMTVSRINRLYSALMSELTTFLGSDSPIEIQILPSSYRIHKSL